jgi:hypothetical protein
MAWYQKSAAELRRIRCETLYLLEVEFRKMDFGDPKLGYDEENDFSGSALMDASLSAANTPTGSCLGSGECRKRTLSVGKEP